MSFIPVSIRSSCTDLIPQHFFWISVVTHVRCQCRLIKKKLRQRIIRDHYHNYAQRLSIIKQSKSHYIILPKSIKAKVTVHFPRREFKFSKYLNRLLEFYFRFGEVTQLWYNTFNLHTKVESSHVVNSEVLVVLVVFCDSYTCHLIQ